MKMKPLEHIPRYILSEANSAYQKALEKLCGDSLCDKPGSGQPMQQWSRGLFRAAGQAGLLVANAGVNLTASTDNLLRVLLAHEVQCGNVAAAGMPVLSNGPAADAVQRLGTADQKAKWLPPLAAGEIAAGVAFLEAEANTDLQAISTVAVKAGDGYRLAGSKTAVHNLDCLDVLITLARLDGDGGFGLFLVDTKNKGVKLSNQPGQPCTEVALRDVQVGGDCLLGAAPAAIAEVERMQSILRLVQCVRSVARADLALGLAIDCAKKKNLDGKSIIDNQSAQFKLSELKAELFTGRTFLDECVSRIAANPEEAPARTLMARLWIPEVEEKILAEASQVIGPHARTGEYPLERLAAEARAENLSTGSREVIRAQIFERTSIARDGDFDAVSMDREPSIFGDEHRLYRNAFRRFFEKEIEPYCHDWIPTGKVPKDIYGKAARAGLLAGGVPEDYGGAGADEINYLVGCEEVGRSRAGPIVGPLFQSDGLVELLKKHGTERQKQTWFKRLVDGAVPAFAMTEPQSGSDVRAFRTVARRDGNDYVINGNKCYISFARVADFFFLLAKTDINNPKHLSFFIVDASTPGIHANRMTTKLYHCGDTCEVFFTDVRVPAENLLGEVEGQALNHAKGMLDLGHIQVGARALGSADLAYRQALDFARDRTVFGRNLLEFENTRSVLAQVKTEINVARALLDYCYMRFKDGTMDHATGSISKLWHSNFEWRTVDRCFQMFGGAGFISEHPISHQLYGARVDRILDGTDEMQKQAISYSL